MPTARRLLLGWSFVCVVGWLVVGVLAERAEARCRGDHGLLCLDSGWGLVAAAALAGAVWLVGAIVLAVVRALARRPLP